MVTRSTSNFGLVGTDWRQRIWYRLKPGLRYALPCEGAEPRDSAWQTASVGCAT